MRRIGSLLVLVVLGSLAANPGVPAPAAAQSGEQGSVCIHRYASGIACEGADVGVEALVLDSIVEDCGADATAQVVLDVVLSTGGATRYDIGMFVALNGDSALSGGLCYHDYLAPPLSTSPTYGDDYANSVPDIRNGPWADLEPFVQPEDSCGDMQANTEAIKTLKAPGVPLQIDCADTNQDGTVDVSVCTSWSNGTQNRCDAVSDAVPPGAERCSCARVEVLPEPGAALALACSAALLAALARCRAH